jgi:hypothetical protein
MRDGSYANMEQLHDVLGLGERRISVVRGDDEGGGEGIMRGKAEAGNGVGGEKGGEDQVVAAAAEEEEEEVEDEEEEKEEEEKEENEEGEEEEEGAQVLAREE